LRRYTLLHGPRWQQTGYFLEPFMTHVIPYFIACRRVMAGRDPAIQPPATISPAWMPGSRPGMTSRGPDSPEILRKSSGLDARLNAGHDGRAQKPRSRMIAPKSTDRSCPPLNPVLFQLRRVRRPSRRVFRRAQRETPPQKAQKRGVATAGRAIFPILKRREGCFT
jgi:hypothetical protein